MQPDSAPLRASLQATRHTNASNGSNRRSNRFGRTGAWILDLETPIHMAVGGAFPQRWLDAALFQTETWFPFGRELVSLRTLRRPMGRRRGSWAPRLMRSTRLTIRAKAAERAARREGRRVGTSRARAAASRCTRLWTWGLQLHP
jgi:hypothetical protein